MTNTKTELLQPPAIGNLVEVRKTKFIVKNVKVLHGQGIVSKQNNSTLGNTHLVTLTSLEDEDLGRETEVYWEKEPGAKILIEGSFPNPARFDSPEVLEQFLLAVKWGLVASSVSEDLHAPFRSGIDVEDYQLDPLIRSLKMPRANLLIADDVGLGKTIEAGLVIQEFLLRHKARSVLVVCPSTLEIQWKEQMRDKFGLDFRIVDGETLKELRKTKGLSANPWTHYPRLITSIDYIKREKPLQMMKELFHVSDGIPYPRRFDILVVDEAHMVAPSGSGQYSVDSLRTQAIRTIAPHFEHKLFLTATPHNGHSDSFTSLLETLDNQRFTKGIDPDPKQKQAILIRRLKSELPENSSNAKFPKREIETIDVDYSDQEAQLHKLLHSYTNAKLEQSKDEKNQSLVYFVLKLLKKRLFSSPEAFYQTFETHLNSQKIRKVIEKPKQKLLAGVWGSQSFEDLYEADVEEVVEEQEEFEDREFELFSQEIQDDTSSLKSISDQLLKNSKTLSNQGDTKLKSLLEWLQKAIKPNGTWSHEKVIIFTEYRTTQKWLIGHLERNGFGEKGRIELLDGSTKEEDRERIKNSFLAEPSELPLRILLATDAASQGINLHHYCRYLIHYDIPWNPNRLEQRNGRLDRHGQKNPIVSIFHFAPKDYEKKIKSNANVSDWEGEMEFLGRIVRKVEEIRKDLGSVSQVMTEDMTKQIGEIFSGRKSKNNFTGFRVDAQSEKVKKELLKFERNLKKDLESALQKYQETKAKLAITPENLTAIVQLGLKLAGQPELKPGELKGHPVFYVPDFIGTWNVALEGLSDPNFPERRRPITFDPEFAQGNEKVVLAHLNHKLVKLALGLVRRSLWASEIDHKLSRYSVMSANVTEPTILFYVRYLWIGSTYERLDESLEVYGFSFAGKSPKALTAKETGKLITVSKSNNSIEKGKDWVLKKQDEIKTALISFMESEKKNLLPKQEKLFQEISAREIKEIRDLLGELDNKIETKFKEMDLKESEYLPNLNLDEQKQFAKDKQGLLDRRAQIPKEIKIETDRIRMKYEAPEGFAFPVAIQVLFPEEAK